MIPHHPPARFFCLQLMHAGKVQGNKHFMHVYYEEWIWKRVYIQYNVYVPSLGQFTPPVFQTETSKIHTFPHPFEMYSRILDLLMQASLVYALVIMYVINPSIVLLAILS